MLSIQRPSSSTSSRPSSKLVPNILPCRINHDGPVDAKKRFWDVEDEEGPQKKKTAYFRGRKLVGSELGLQEGYRGVIVRSTGRNMPMVTKEDHRRLPAPIEGDEEEDEEEEEVEPVRILKEIATFDSIIVWDHEKMPESEDPFMKGMNEWIGFAEVMHSFEDTGDKAPS